MIIQNGSIDQREKFLEWLYFQSTLYTVVSVSLVIHFLTVETIVQSQ